MVVNKGGKPLIFDTPEQLDEQIKAYFRYCDENDKPYTIAGMAVWLDVDRQTIYNYAKREKYFDIIKKARDVILASWEERVIAEGKPGQIFIMKNYGYTDMNEQQQAKVKADTEQTKAKTKLIKETTKDTSLLDALTEALQDK